MGDVMRKKVYMLKNKNKVPTQKQIKKLIEFMKNNG